MRNQLRLRLPLQDRRCAPTHRPSRSLRRRRPYVVTFEHVRDPLRVRATDLRDLQLYLRATHPTEAIVSIRDEHGNLAGRPPAVSTAGGHHLQLVLTLTLAVALGAVSYGLSFLLG